LALFRELNRRNVIRVAIAYLAVAWLLTEVVGTLFPAFGIPDWGVRFVVFVFALGFVPTLIFSWVYELTPEGLKREKDVEREVSITHRTARRLDGITIGLIVLAVVFVMTDRLWLSPMLVDRSATTPEVVYDEKPATAPASTDVLYPPHSIAVLPFANRSANPDDAFFVDGIHDDLLTHIAKIGSIKTISRTSVLRYRDSTMAIPEIARELGVGAVLEGGVQRAGQQVRINVQLIDAESDAHLWSETYDRQLSATNVFAIQSEIAEAIAAALKTTLSPEEQERIRSAPTDNLAAYEAYLIGRQRMATRTTAGLADAVLYFRRAIEIDPEFALAWVGLADTYQLQVTYSGLPVEKMISITEATLEKALELDGDLGEAYASFGLLKFDLKDLEGAVKFFQRSIELSPNYAPAYQWYALVLEALGRSEEARANIATAVQLDPMSAIIRQNHAVSLRREGRFDEAMEELETALVIDAGFPGAHDGIATMQYQVYNRFDEAVRGYLKLIAVDPNRAGSYVWLGQVYLDLTDLERASRLFDRAVELAPDGANTTWARELIRLYRGDYDGVVESARKILMRWESNHWIAQFSAAQLRNHALAAGRHSEALDVYSETYPQLLAEQQPGIGLHNFRAAIDLTLVLQKSGEIERAKLLLDRVLEFIRSQPRLGWWGGYWVSDVQILALQGKKAEALTALRQAVDEGWRSLWWYYLKLDPNLDSIRDEPEFLGMVDEIAADMASQLQEIEEMELDLPLTDGN
jgi:TolB-like protein/lipoprotein NlpI